MGQTSHYKWNQPEPWEPAEHRDYAKTLSAIDTAVAAKADSTSVNSRFSTLETELDSRFTAVDSSISGLNKRLEVIVGSYRGNGEASRNIYLGFTPKAVLVEIVTGWRGGDGTSQGGMALTNQPAQWVDPLIKIVTDGFQVYLTETSNTNHENTLYYYLVCR